MSPFINNTIQAVFTQYYQMPKQLKQLREKQHEEWKNSEIKIDDLKPETPSAETPTTITTPKNLCRKIPFKTHSIKCLLHLMKYLKYLIKYLKEKKN